MKKGKKYHMFIDGEWVEAKSGRRMEVVNPANNESFASVPCADLSDVDLAVKAARRSFEKGIWSDIDPMSRGRVLNKVSQLIMDRLDELAETSTLEAGKPISESNAIDVPQAAKAFEYFAGLATGLRGSSIPLPGEMLDYTVREPVGVVGLITPWNFPLHIESWKLGPALITGNSCILKPASLTPLTALLLAEIMNEAGIPDGVVNVITGSGKKVGEALVDHKEVNKIGFTGSTKVGKAILKKSANNMKRVSLELGGKSSNIVFSDCDFNRAVEGAMAAVFINQGENCCAGTRLLIEEEIYDKFVMEIVRRTEMIKIGNPRDKNTQLGALISPEQQRIVEWYIKKGVEEGAKILTGGKRPETPDLKKGNFLLPTILGDVNNKMVVAREEIFGPVLVVIPFRDEEDAVTIANDSNYGLAAGIWTTDITKGHRVAKRIRTGTVWINTYNMVFAEAPFGGYKESGIGRDLGHEVLNAYTEVKNVIVDISQRGLIWYGIK